MLRTRGTSPTPTVLCKVEVLAGATRSGIVDHVIYLIRLCGWLD